MKDLLILESIIAVLLLIYLIRPFVRKFRGVDGLNILPALSLLLMIAVYPAFGFRPELLPLLLFSLFAFLSSLPRLVDIARRLRVDDYGERQPILALGCLIVLIGAFVFAVVFAPIVQPQVQTALLPRMEVADENRKTSIVMISEGFDSENGAAPKPLVVFGPPVLGSSGLTDTYRAALAAKGVAVLTYYRPGFDFPAIGADGRTLFPQFKNGVDAVVSMLWGRSLAFAAEAGARLERERLEDLKFTIAYIRSRIAAGDERFKNIDGTKISIAGYGASGAAALMYAAEADPSAVRSVIAIEAPVHSYLSVEVKQAESKPDKRDSTIYGSVVRLVGVIKRTLTVRTVLGPIRGNEAAQAVKVPTMLLVSDWIRDVAQRDVRYATLVSVMRFSKAPCSIVSVSGAGPVHFADVHSDYPVYGFFAQGKDKFIPRNTPFAPLAASLTASFIDGTLTSSKAGAGVLIEKNK